MKRINPEQLSEADLDRLGAEAETLSFENTQSLTADARDALARAAGKRGRPQVGAGAKRINITIEQRLLDQADAYARENGLTRSAVVAAGLMRIVARVAGPRRVQPTKHSGGAK